MPVKSIDLNVNDIDMKRRTAVIAHATYKTLDRDGDRSNQGMFNKSWREQKKMVRFFLNHDKTLAPGKALNFWDDPEHAFTQVEFGTHTLGEDTLKQLDEGIIIAASFGFLPMKTKDIKGKGQDLLEVQHLETSVLTHWGAHDESGVVAVKKSAMEIKQLTDTEQAVLQRLISNGVDSLEAAVKLAGSLNEDSDMYTQIYWMISRQADQIGDLKSQLRYGRKDTLLIERIEKMESFIRNTKASDEAIFRVIKELGRAKQFLKQNTDTAISTEPSLVKCPKCNTSSVGIADEQGRVKCAECDHVLIKSSQPDASSNKDALMVQLQRLRLSLDI